MFVNSHCRFMFMTALNRRLIRAKIKHLKMQDIGSQALKNFCRLIKNRHLDIR